MRLNFNLVYNRLYSLTDNIIFVKGLKMSNVGQTDYYNFKLFLPS